MKTIIYITLFVLLTVQVYALEIKTEYQSSAITLVDVSSDGESCIFNVYGKTVVVDKRDKATVNGITIYVQDVYPMNNEAQNTDRCKFMYSGAVQQTSEEQGSAVQEMTIGEKVVKFLLGTRSEAEVAQETDEKETPDTTRVTVGGYEVTQKQEAKNITTSSEEPRTFFQKLKRFLFG